MQSVSTFFKEEDDFFYQQGEKKTKEKMSRKFVERLILESDLSDDQIGRIVEVEVDFVKERRAEMGTK